MSNDLNSSNSNSANDESVIIPAGYVGIHDSHVTDYEILIGGESDPQLFQIIMMHGPFYVPHRGDSCIACNVLWPCRTFKLFSDRAVRFNFNPPVGN